MLFVWRITQQIYVEVCIGSKYWNVVSICILCLYVAHLLFCVLYLNRVLVVSASLALIVSIVWIVIPPLLLNMYNLFIWFSGIISADDVAPGCAPLLYDSPTRNAPLVVWGHGFLKLMLMSFHPLNSSPFASSLIPWDWRPYGRVACFGSGVVYDVGLIPISFTSYGSGLFFFYIIRSFLPEGQCVPLKTN